jgi:hypothetical protein
MKTKLIAVASVAVITLAAIATPKQAEARWRGHGGWWVPGAVVGGLALGAAIASRPYYGYGYAPGPYYGGYAYASPYGYYGGVGPYDYEYNGSYSYQPSYRYDAPYRHWTEF